MKKMKNKTCYLSILAGVAFLLLSVGCKEESLQPIPPDMAEAAATATVTPADSEIAIPPPAAIVAGDVEMQELVQLLDSQILKWELILPAGQYKCKLYAVSTPAAEGAAPRKVNCAGIAAPVFQLGEGAVFSLVLRMPSLLESNCILLVQGGEISSKISDENLGDLFTPNADETTFLFSRLPEIVAQEENRWTFQLGRGVFQKQNNSLSRSCELFLEMTRQ